MSTFKLEETQILLIGKQGCLKKIRPASGRTEVFDIAHLREWECTCDPAPSLFLAAPYHSVECTHVIFLQVKANLVFGSVLRDTLGHKKLSLMSQKGNSNLKFARYPLEKSSMLTSLELKSKLPERLAEPIVLCVKVEVSVFCGRRMLPMLGASGRCGMKNHKSLPPVKSLS